MLSSSFDGFMYSTAEPHAACATVWQDGGQRFHYSVRAYLYAVHYSELSGRLAKLQRTHHGSPTCSTCNVRILIQKIKNVNDTPAFRIE